MRCEPFSLRLTDQHLLQHEALLYSAQAQESNAAAGKAKRQLLHFHPCSQHGILGQALRQQAWRPEAEIGVLHTLAATPLRQAPCPKLLHDAR